MAYIPEIAGGGKEKKKEGVYTEGKKGVDRQPGRFNLTNEQKAKKRKKKLVSKKKEK